MHFRETFSIPLTTLARRISALLVAATIVALSASSVSVQSEVYYVRAGATGADTGSDWTNAYSRLPSTLVRGATYYVADGSYDSHTFTTAESGTTRITIKKATISDHGTNTGWNNSFGDGSADWTDWTIRTSYWTFDGGVGQWAGSMHGVPAVPNHIPHGFRVLRSTTSPNAKAIRIGAFGNEVRFVTLRHVQAGFTNTPRLSSAWADGQDVIYAIGGDFTFSYMWIHDAGRVNLLVGASRDNMLVEHSVLERNGQAVAAGVGSQHSELYSAEGGANHVFRNNLIRDWRSTGGIILHDDNGLAPHFTNFQVYGNVFTTTGYFPARDANGVLNALSDSVNTSAYVYNNIFVDIPGGCSVLTFGGYSTRVVQNNIFYNCQRTNSGAQIGGTRSYNWYANSGSQSEPNIQNGTDDPFVNRSGQNYRLKAQTDSGLSLPSTFAQDPDGNTRGAGGIWTRGAFQFVGLPTTSPPAPPRNLRIVP